MSDALGYFCEAITHVAFQRTTLNWAFHDTEGPNSYIDCLNTCAHRNMCIGSRLPKLHVEPDFVIYGTQVPIFIYVTHAESSNIFNFKFWRTLAESIEQRRFIDGSYCVDLLFGHLREKQEVYLGMEAITDLHPRVALNPSFDIACDFYSKNYNGKYSVLAIAEWIKENTTPAIEELISELEQAVLAIGSSCSTKSSYPGSKVFRKICSESQWSPEANPAPTDSHLRTGVILSSFMGALLGSSQALGRALDGQVLKHVVSAELPYRKRQADILQAWAIDRVPGNAVNSRISFCPEVISARLCFENTTGFLEFCELYVLKIRSDPTWSLYFDLITDQLAVDYLAKKAIQCWGIEEIYELAYSIVMGAEKSGIVEMLCAALDLSMNALSHYLDDRMIEIYGFPLKRLAPHGDDALHVISYLNRSLCSSLSFSRIDQIAFAHWFADEFKKLWLSKTVEGKSPSMADLRTFFIYRLTKTFLTRAPSPIEAVVEEAAECVLTGAGFTRIVNCAMTPTFVNDLLGGKTLRAGITIGYKHPSMGSIEFLISSTSEGNDKHKQKEYAAKIVAKKIKAVRATGLQSIEKREKVRVVAVLDGTWPVEGQNFLSQMGCDFVVTYRNLDRLQAYLETVIGG